MGFPIGAMKQAARAGGDLPAAGLGNKLEKPGLGPAIRRVSEWLAATLEMSCRETGCGFESRALRSSVDPLLL